MTYMEIVEAAASKFGIWKLPQNFAPDGGIVFSPLPTNGGWPVGTNLFTHEQAKQMFDDCLHEVVADRIEVLIERALGDAKRYADAKVSASKGRAEEGEVEGAWHDLRQSIKCVVLARTFQQS